uniref:Uncharacterized protein n=1 Tax=Acrobeloides nanus TaxID=290746 RepID=A0A914ENX1_9BILA
MFTFVIFVLRPQIEFIDGIYIIIINGFIEHVSFPWDFILGLTSFSIIAFVILTMPIPFYYRYACMCR